MFKFSQNLVKLYSILIMVSRSGGKILKIPATIQCYSGSQESEVCPMPYALCPIVPHVTEKGYSSFRLLAG